MKAPSIYGTIADNFYQLQKEGKDEWCIINCIVPMKLLYELYLKLYDAVPIEDIDRALKEKYWGIATKYYEDEPTRIKAAKAAYTLALITSND